LLLGPISLIGSFLFDTLFCCVTYCLIIEAKKQFIHNIHIFEPSKYLFYKWQNCAELTSMRRISRDVNLKSDQNSGVVYGERTRACSWVETFSPLASTENYCSRFTKIVSHHLVIETKGNLHRKRTHTFQTTKTSFLQMTNPRRVNHKADNFSKMWTLGRIGTLASSVRNKLALARGSYPLASTRGLYFGSNKIASHRLINETISLDWGLLFQIVQNSLTSLDNRD
jgi:hypothetical protein